MRCLKKPDFKVEAIVKECAASYSDEEKKERFISCAKHIQEKSVEYENCAEEGEWVNIPQEVKVNGIIDKSEMKSLYDDKFVKHLPEKEKYYDKIMNLAVYGKCPLCGIGQVSTLDHYLAKSIYPTYAVTPINLVPVCKDCNFTKSNTSFSSNSEAPFHPYFDNVDDFIWLKASLEFSENTLVASYYVNDEFSVVNKEMYFRLKNHFEMLELSKAYAVQAATEIAENMSLWIEKYLEWGQEGLRAHLKDCLISKEKVHRNTWNAALLRALIDDIEIIENFMA